MEHVCTVKLRFCSWVKKQGDVPGDGLIGCVTSGAVCSLRTHHELYSHPVCQYANQVILTSYHISLFGVCVEIWGRDCHRIVN